MEENQKKNKKIIVAIISVVVLVAIIGTVVFFVLNAQKLKLYNSTFELGQENYIEELTKQENVYIKEGYSYSIKDNKIDINNVGTYDVTFEIKGKGKTSEEIKQIQVQDTTPPTVELKKDNFYVGDSINIEEIVSIKDLSQAEEITYADAKAQVDGQFDTSKEGESTVNITVEDKNGNKATQELKISVKNPFVNLYDYLKNSMNNTNGGYSKMSLQSGNNISIEYTSTVAGYKTTGYLNFTEKTCKEVTSGSYYSTIDFVYFDDNLNATKYLHSSNYSSNTENIALDSDLGKSHIDVFNGVVDSVYDKLGDKNRKIQLTGKTIEQLKNETIDLREFQQ